MHRRRQNACVVVEGYESGVSSILENKPKPTVEGQNLLAIIENHVHVDYKECIMIAQEEDGKVAGIPDVVQPLLA